MSEVPLFISNRALQGRNGKARKTMPRAVCDWALDSGGFTELKQYGGWRTTPEQYVAQVRRYVQEIGRLQFASQQDWMCEESQLARTGYTVREHQALTVMNYLTLRELAPELPWMPVLQGWSVGEYLDHAELFERCGVELAKCARVGVGSICRRNTWPVRTTHLLRILSEDHGLKLHAFGAKSTILAAAADLVASADSLAWSYHERREKTGNQNKLSAALAWHEKHIAPVIVAEQRRELARAA